LVYISVSSAAAVFIAFFLGIYFNKQSSLKLVNTQSLAYNQIIVPLGAKSQVILSDGSKVWLNAGSKLKYPVSFLNGSREVFLEGEAFFDVTKINHKQFIVKTSNLNIKVYGTQFNVKAYSEENQIQTTLVKGSVALEPLLDNNNTVYFLKPNQTATFFKSNSTIKTTNNQLNNPDSEKGKADEGIFVVNKIDPLPIISWKDKEWIFKGEELGQLAVKLERRYNVKISFEDISLKTYKFSGTITDLTFEQVLMVIQLSAPILFNIDGNNVVFKGNSMYRNKYDKMILKSKS
jgi:ferric-dicitrate binding protein FerR (iron transport regulator)